MCTVAQLIAKLQKFPQDAIVEVMGEYTRCHETCTEYRPLDIEHFDSCILDYRSEYYTERYPHIAGQVFVQLEAI